MEKLTELQENQIKKSLDFAKEFHSKDNTGHGFDHILRVLETSLKILRTEPTANSFVVQISSILHDIDDRKLSSERLVPKFLQEINIPKDLQEEILSTIGSISFSSSGENPNFKTIEQKIVSDSDKLDAIGAIGIYRTFAYGVSHGHKLFDSEVPPMTSFTLEEYKKDIQKIIINHFFDKLLKLKNAMQTEYGKKEAIKRHNLMVEYLKNFFEEENEPRWIEYLKNY